VGGTGVGAWVGTGTVDDGASVGGGGSGVGDGASVGDGVGSVGDGASVDTEATDLDGTVVVSVRVGTTTGISGTDACG